MIEIPATAMLADQFAKEVVLLQLVPNINTQWLPDRMNEQVSYLYQPYNPVILHV